MFRNTTYLLLWHVDPSFKRQTKLSGKIADYILMSCVWASLWDNLHTRFLKRRVKLSLFFCWAKPLKMLFFSLCYSIMVQRILKWSLKNKMLLHPVIQDTGVPFHSFHLTTSQKRHLFPSLSTIRKQKADQSTVFSHANTTSLIQTTQAATAIILRLLLQHLWISFFSQLILIWCLSWSVNACVKRCYLWTLKLEFYLAWRNMECNE